MILNKKYYKKYCNYTYIYWKNILQKKILQKFLTFINFDWLIYYIDILNLVLFEGSLEANFRQYGQMKSRDGKSQKKRRVEERRSEKKGRKVAKHCVFPMICGSGGSKSRLAKAAGAEPSGQMRDKKLHTVVARSTFPSQNAENTPAPDHFWKLRCRKSARRCGAKHICKWKS